ncbi:MAG: UDP-N-acetylglucosamine diphosphorylase/glucosamine-1-phosphate N-acetyltransferase [Acidobacteria bacterium RIFCSPLOWO2_12_FULL_54_10]|nr:MAG: UDP-N-acetylglucosamine diphosphorylase/glucosamine-1-phosphate N-acetyltransferase [Acidobacteria bacterium RIFCSPLOWO2_12_FULL_54_10]
MNKQFAVAILGAGLGTRFKSKRAKLLHEAGGRKLIEHAVRTAAKLSASKIFAIVGYQADAIQKAITEADSKLAGGKVRFLLQDKPLGTGHALKCGQKELRAAAPLLLVYCGDTPLLRPETLRDFLSYHRRLKATATVMTAIMADPSGYGRMVRSADGQVDAIVEHKSASADILAIREINTGIYCFDTKELFSQLDRLKPDRLTGEYYLTDVISGLRQECKRVEGYPIADAGEVMGVNTRIELAQADALLRARKAREMMLHGVTIMQPESVRIDPDVEIGPDTILEPGVMLLGSTRVGSDCSIGAYSRITNSRIEDGVTILQCSVVADSIIKREASVGPFAHIRPGTEVGPQAKIGNFVEVKKSKIGRGTKAGHLTYLGDAIIGDNVNVGAGTITCNYDGEKKHTTIIESNAFIGSGTELVAPIRIGRNAYVGAGSTITKNVPADALAVARTHQVIKPEWVKQRKRKSKAKKKA